MSNSITQDMTYRQSLMKYAEKYGCRFTIDVLQRIKKRVTNGVSCVTVKVADTN